jgi:hypothetical protein
VLVRRRRLAEVKRGIEQRYKDENQKVSAQQARAVVKWSEKSTQAEEGNGATIARPHQRPGAGYLYAGQNKYLHAECVYGRNMKWRTLKNAAASDMSARK